jgi:hypothetical protein
MAFNVVVEKNVFPFHTGTHVVHDPRLVRAAARTRNHNADVNLSIGKRSRGRQDQEPRSRCEFQHWQVTTPRCRQGDILQRCGKG